MKRRYIILSVIGFGMLICLGFLSNYWFEQRTQKNILAKSSAFVLAWANYSDSISDQYFDSITPYVSTDIINEYKDSSGEIKSARGEKSPSKSKFTISVSPTIKKNKKSYDTVLGGVRKYSLQSKPIEQQVFMHWEKIKGKYVITEVYTDK